MANQYNSKIDRDSAVVLVGVVLFFFSYFALQFELLADACPRAGDFALISLEVEYAKTWSALTGPYSRFNFRHPGPIYFYFYAMGETFFWFISSIRGQHLLTQLVLNASCIIAASWIFIRFLGAKAGLILFLAVLVCFGSAEKRVFYELWGPTAIVAPVLLFASALAPFATGRLAYTPLVAIASSLAVQNHLGAVAVVIPMLTIGMFLAIYNRFSRSLSFSKVEILWLILTVLIGGISAWPILLDAYLSPGLGNLGAIADFISARSETPSFDEAIGFVASYYYLPLRELLGAPRGSALKYLVLLAVLTLPFLLKPKAGGVVHLLRCFLLCSIFFSLLGALGISGKMYGSLLRYELSYVAIGYTLSVLGVLSLFKKDFISTRFQTLSLVLFCLIGIGFGLQRYHVSKRSCRDFHPIVEAIKDSSKGPVELSIRDRKAWKDVALIALLLEREQVDFCVSSGWKVLFGQRRVCLAGIERQKVRFDRGREVESDNQIVAHGLRANFP